MHRLVCGWHSFNAFNNTNTSVYLNGGSVCEMGDDVEGVPGDRLQWMERGKLQYSVEDSFGEKNTVECLVIIC